MNKQKIFLILSIMGILILLLISQNLNQPALRGKISEIKYENNRISIKIENSEKEIILFTNKFLILKKSQEIIIYGKEQTYKNQTQIIAEKIIKITS
jgi:hypothetical protein